MQTSYENGISYLYVGYRNGKIAKLRQSDMSEVAISRLQFDAVKFLVSKDIHSHTFVYTVSTDTVMRKLRGSDLEEVAIFRGHSKRMYVIVTVDDNHPFVYTCSLDETIRKFRKSDLKEVARFKKTGWAWHTLCISQEKDDVYIYAGSTRQGFGSPSGGGSIIKLRLSNLEEVNFAFQVHGNGFIYDINIVYEKDDIYLITGGDDSRVVKSRVSDLSQVQSLNVFQDRVHSIHIDNESGENYIYASSIDKTVKKIRSSDMNVVSDSGISTFNNQLWGLAHFKNVSETSLVKMYMKI